VIHALLLRCPPTACCCFCCCSILNPVPTAIHSNASCMMTSFFVFIYLTGYITITYGHLDAALYLCKAPVCYEPFLVCIYSLSKCLR